MVPKFTKSLLTATLCLTPAAMAQEVTKLPSLFDQSQIVESVVDAQGQPAVPTASPGPQPAPAPQAEAKGWRKYTESASGLVRFRGQDNSKGDLVRKELQYIVDVKLRYDVLPGGKLAVRGRIETGNNFKNNANDLVGTYPATGASKVIAAKQLFLDFKPNADVNLQGGFMPSKTPGQAAAGSIFSLDADGWVDGVRAMRNNLLPWANEVAVTVGHVGDFSKVQFWDRTDNMSDINFMEVHVRGDLTKFLSNSVSVIRYEGNTFLVGSETIKVDAIGDLKIKFPKLVQFVNKIIIDGYMKNTEYQGFGATIKTASIRDVSGWFTVSHKAAGSTSLNATNLPQEDFYQDGVQLSFGLEKKFTNVSKHFVMVPFVRGGFTVAGKTTGSANNRGEAGLRIDVVTKPAPKPVAPAAATPKSIGQFREQMHEWHRQSVGGTWVDQR